MFNYYCATVYLYMQDNFPSVDESQLKDMDKRVTELQEKFKQNQSECHRLETSKYTYGQCCNISSIGGKFDNGVFNPCLCYNCYMYCTCTCTCISQLFFASCILYILCCTYNMLKLQHHHHSIKNDVKNFMWGQCHLIVSYMICMQYSIVRNSMIVIPSYYCFHHTHDGMQHCLPWPVH